MNYEQEWADLERYYPEVADAVRNIVVKLVKLGEIEALMAAMPVGAPTTPVVPVHLPEAAPVVMPKVVPASDRWRACKYCGRSYNVMGIGSHEKTCAGAPKEQRDLAQRACRHCGRQVDKRGLATHEMHCPSADPVDRLVAEREEQLASPPPPLSIVDRLEDDDTPSLECRHCAKSFRTVDGRLRHERGCEGTLAATTSSTLTCEDCGRTFVYTSGLVQHQIRCPGPKATGVNVKTAVLRCDDCPQTFELTGITKLIAHTLVTHKREVRPGERIPQAAAS